jgi:hypothetical protein
MNVRAMLTMAIYYTQVISDLYLGNCFCFKQILSIFVNKSYYNVTKDCN